MDFLSRQLITQEFAPVLRLPDLGWYALGRPRTGLRNQTSGLCATLCEVDLPASRFYPCALVTPVCHMACDPS